jgi:uncharacterized membrane protein YcaP (DUF421 family)
VDMLELRLRQQGIQNISDIQWASIESNGQLGYILKPEKQYATKQDIQALLSILQSLKPGLSNQNIISQSNEDNLFTEVFHVEHKHEPRENLK